VIQIQAKGNNWKSSM